jgi:membrane protease YdiL (CAAX protease family)
MSDRVIAMMKYSFSLRRMFARTASFYAAMRSKPGAIGKGCFLVLLGMYFFIFLGEEEVSGFVIAVAIASFVFLVQDIKVHRLEINYVANVCVITAFFSLLSVCLWLGAREFPPLVAEATKWYRQFGVALAISCVGGAIVEEVVFRRYLQVHLQRYLSVNWAIFVSALLFMFAHGFASLSLFVAGVTYGIIASHLKAIHAAMLIHATSNVFGAASLNITGEVNQEGLSSAIALSGSSTMAQLILTLLLLMFMGCRTLYRAGRSYRHAKA